MAATLRGRRHCRTAVLNYRIAATELGREDDMRLGGGILPRSWRREWFVLYYRAALDRYQTGRDII